MSYDLILFGIIVAVPIAALFIFFGVGIYLVLAAREDMRQRVPPQFRGDRELMVSMWVLAWMPGIPVRTRRRVMLAAYCFCGMTIFLALFAGLLTAGTGMYAGAAPFLFATSFNAVLVVGYTLSARIRHRDKLR
jgi:hypothetical protein